MALDCKFLAEMVVGEEFFYLGGQSRGTGRFDDKSIHSVLNYFGYRPDSRGDRRHFRGHCFDKSPGETFFERGENKYVKGGH